MEEKERVLNEMAEIAGEVEGRRFKKRLAKQKRKHTTEEQKEIVYDKNGEKIHSTPATTRQNIHDTRRLSFRPLIKMNIARVHPAIINMEPKIKKNQPINCGGAFLPSNAPNNIAIPIPT